LVSFFSIEVIRNPYNYDGAEVNSSCRKSYHSLHVQVAENQSRQAANLQSFYVQTVAIYRLNEMVNAANLVVSTDAPNAGLLDHSRRISWAVYLLPIKFFLKI
jgi:hypothetical protein